MCAFPNHFRSVEQFSGNTRKAWGQCGKTPPASAARRAPSAVRIPSGARARAWVQVTLFQHTPAVPRPRSLAPVPIPVFLACVRYGRSLARYSHCDWRWWSLAEYFLRASCLGEQMGEVVQFIPKPAPDRAARLIQEARAIYESIFPTEIASIAPIEDDDTSS